MGHADTHRHMHSLAAAQDFDAFDEHLAASFSYDDRARGITVKSADEFKEWLRGWFTSFSDARPDEGRYLEGADFSLSLFQGRGINDGPLGELPPTNRQMDLPFAELLEYDADGKVRYGAIYYDQVTLLTQLGHMPPQGG
jgi:SnoaL-like polyketide cyclase